MISETSKPNNLRYEMRFFTDASETAVKFFGLLYILTIPIHPVISTAVALGVADIVTGIWAAVKMGEPLTSRKFKRKIPMIVCYVGGIFLMFLTEKYMIPDIPLVKTLAAMIAVNEGKSISENFYKITGVDLFKVLIEKLGASQATNPAQSDQSNVTNKPE